ncbi:TetR/AcrR family transcriptional regulator [Nonomuraea sp. SMC257]|uniref:TetR/AcrR family transcriptional regulator n=1 Tax=Nonomuraea montanisoli TaxID=2741721 RepID=A0A7Y6I4B0_9ACTN|nr:TetR/AcrR family transcriptional regulator [Nonomuraea montanisoli]NUW31191.1 TetR/AcrR family transcriptional regulator [Nonomuraea montanisoli]
MIDEETARERVVSTADRLFYAHGVQAVGMDTVRTEAGVSLKRIYALFPSKDDLVLAVLRRRTHQWDTGVTGAVSRAGTPRDQVLAVFDFLAEWFLEDAFRGCAFINVFGELGGDSDRIAAAVREQKASFQRRVTELVHEAGCPGHLAPQLVLLAEGAQTTAAISRDPGTAAHARAAADTLIRHALGDFQGPGVSGT